MNEFYFIKSNISIYRPDLDYSKSLKKLAFKTVDAVRGSLPSGYVMPLLLRTSFLNKRIAQIYPDPVMLFQTEIATDEVEGGIKMRSASAYSHDVVNKWLSTPWLLKYFYSTTAFSYLGMTQQPKLKFFWISPAHQFFTTKELNSDLLSWSNRQGFELALLAPSKRDPKNKPTGEILTRFHNNKFEPAASIYLNELMNRFLKRVVSTGGHWEKSNPEVFNIHLKKDLTNPLINYKPLKIEN